MTTTKSTAKKASATRAKSISTRTSKTPVAKKQVVRASAAKPPVPAIQKTVVKRTAVASKATPDRTVSSPARIPASKKPALIKKVAPQPKLSAAIAVTSSKSENPKKAKPAKAKKAKLVRDSFTMPDIEYALISELKKRCLDAGLAVKKSEILRASIANLSKLNTSSVLAAVRRLEVIKTGRPAKGRK